MPKIEAYRLKKAKIEDEDRKKAENDKRQTVKKAGKSDTIVSSKDPGTTVLSGTMLVNSDAAASKGSSDPTKKIG